MNPILAYWFVKTGVNNFINGLALSLAARTFNSDNFVKEYEEILKKHVNTIGFSIPNLENKEILLPYLIKLTENVTDDELNLVMNRIENVTIKRGLPNLSNTGTYNPRFNVLKYVFKSSIGHEFLHLASSFYDKLNNIWLCGFQRVKDNLIIGRGLNEGYTELLASRYYNKDGKVSAYTSLVNICEMLELFFDNDNDMRKLYFSCNLPEFIKKMNEYMTDAEVYKLLFEMDLEIKTISPKRCKAIQSFLYNKFMSKCNDQKKIDKMNELAIKSGILCYSILNKEKVEKKMEALSASDVLKKTSRVYFKKTGAIIAASAIILAVGQYKDKVKYPSSYAETLVNNCTQDEAFILNEEMFLNDLQNHKPVSSYDGKYLYQAIISSKIKYCDILDEFYTLHGGDITFNTYRAICLNYYCDAEPIYANNKIVTYAYYPNTSLPANTKYEIIDGKVYYVNESLFKEIILPNGETITEISSEELSSYDKIELVDSLTVSSKPYIEIKDYNLLCDAEKTPYVFSDGHEEDKWNVEYSLEYKKN